MRFLFILLLPWAVFAQGFTNVAVMAGRTNGELMAPSNFFIKGIVAGSNMVIIPTNNGVGWKLIINSAASGGGVDGSANSNLSYSIGADATNYANGVTNSSIVRQLDLTASSNAVVTYANGVTNASIVRQTQLTTASNALVTYANSVTNSSIVRQLELTAASNSLVTYANSVTNSSIVRQAELTSASNTLVSSISTKQHGTAVLTNLSGTGAQTNRLNGLQFATNAGIVYIKEGAEQTNANFYGPGTNYGDFHSVSGSFVSGANLYTAPVGGVVFVEDIPISKSGGSLLLNADLLIGTGLALIDEGSAGNTLGVNAVHADTLITDSGLIFNENGGGANTIWFQAPLLANDFVVSLPDDFPAVPGIWTNNNGLTGFWPISELPAGGGAVSAMTNVSINGLTNFGFIEYATNGLAEGALGGAIGAYISTNYISFTNGPVQWLQLTNNTVYINTTNRDAGTGHRYIELNLVPTHFNQAINRSIILNSSMRRFSGAITNACVSNKVMVVRLKRTGGGTEADVWASVEPEL